MHRQTVRAFAFAAGVAILAFSGWVGADPPSRVARLGYASGAVSFSPAGENDWVQATINRPLTSGDRLWTDAGARAEIQIGGAMIRMHAGSGASILNLDERIAQLQLTQGTLNVRVRRLRPGQTFEVDTPNLAFVLRQPGAYRIEVDPEGNATTIVVRKGQGEAYGEGASYVIDARQPFRFTGTGLREYQYVDAPRIDEFDRWSSARDRRYDTSRSARYVSEDVVGYQDLDANGTWRVDATYGNVWTPNRVDAGWAPYRDGHWAWIDPWGWTWVDDAPWGYAVSHYGRWTNLRGTWGWVPGPVRTQAYYAPALVAFVGGANFQFMLSGGNVGGVAWFPLAPREVYRPAYPVSRGYFENINRSNTVINNTVINNYYNNPNLTNVVYANRQVPGAIVAVPTTAFVQSQPVSKVAQRVTREAVAAAPVAFVAPVAPTERSVRGAAAQRDRPPARVFERPVIVRSAPPAAHAGFAAQQPQLTATPGKPLDNAARRELKPAAAAPVVKVVTPIQATPPRMRPPSMAPGAKSGEARARSDARGAVAAPATSGVTGARTQGAAPAQPQATPPVPAARAPDPRTDAAQRGQREGRGQPAASPAPIPQRAAPPQVAPAQAAPPGPSAQPQQQRGRAEQRGQGDQRAQPAASPAPIPQRAAPRQVAPAQAAPPGPSAQPQQQPQQQRGRAEQRGQGEQREQRGQPMAAPQPPPQRSMPPAVVPVPQVAPPAPAAQPQRARPEPAAKQIESRPPVAAPKPAPAQAAPTTEPRGEARKPGANKPNDRKKDGDEQKREEEIRKQRG